MSMSQQEPDVGRTNPARRAWLAGVDGVTAGIHVPAPPSPSPYTPASHALCAGLVLEEIIECVFRGGNPKHTLVNLALTNKAQLLDPVMDRVWGTMHSLAPFFLLLPHDDTAANGAKKIIMTITSPTSKPNAPSTSEFNTPLGFETTTSLTSELKPTFMKYAKRLRHLVFQRKTSSDAIPLLSHIRLAYLQSREAPFFPSLKSVRFTSTEVGQHLAASVELIPFCPIIKLEFTDLHVETATLVTVLSFLSLRFADTLQELRLNMPIAERHFSMQSLHYLISLGALHTLSITCQNSDFPIFELIPWVLGLRNLRNLELTAQVERLLPKEYGKLRPTSRALNVLRLGGCIDFIRTVLASFGGGHGATGVQGTVTFSPSLPLNPTDQEHLTAFVYINFPAQPSVCFDLPKPSPL